MISAGLARPRGDRVAVKSEGGAATEIIPINY